MPAISSRFRAVYRVPSTGREFMTLRAACRREAFAQAKRKYGCEEGPYSSYNMKEDARLMLAVGRLARLLERKYRRDDKVENGRA